MIELAYAEIKSQFVKSELQKTPWQKRQYIIDLTLIEKFALDTYGGMGAGYIRNYLRDYYPQQWNAIWLELNPQEYKRWLTWEERKKKRERKGERKEEARWQREESRERKREKEEWKKMGGVIEDSTKTRLDLLP